MTNFDNKVVWITGASSGIGEGLAYALAEKGAHLILSSRDAQKLEEVKLKCKTNRQILVLPLDVSDFKSIEPAVHNALQTFPKIDVLINNAGRSQRALIEETDFEVDRKIMDVNYFGTIALTKAVLPNMIKNQKGHIVVISSVMGKFGAPQRSAYCASKHALHGYFDSLRAEVEERYNIKVTIICPGYVHTQVTINAFKGDGTKNNIMAENTKNGFTPEAFAKLAIRAMEKEKPEALIAGRLETSAVLAKRFVPGFFAKMVRRWKG